MVTLQRFLVSGLWLILIITLVVLGYLAFHACGIRMLGYELSWCRMAPSVNAGEARREGLALELAALQRSYRQLPLCVASPEGSAGLSPLPSQRVVPDASANPPPSGSSQPSSPPLDPIQQGAAPGGGNASLPPGGGGGLPLQPSAGQGEGGGQGSGAAAGDGGNGQGGGSGAGNGGDGQGGGGAGAGNDGDGQGGGAGAGDGSASAEACVPDTGSASIILALDHSRSMGLPSDLDDNIAIELEREIEQGTPSAWAARNLYNGYIEQPGEKRLDVLKNAVKQSVGRLSERVDVGLLTFAGCGGVGDVGMFSAEKRPELISRVQALEPKPGTPIAEALTAAFGRASQTPNGRIILVSDGHDTCEGDPCQIARANPGTRVDVIALGGSQALSCIAEATGGQLIEGSFTQEIDTLIDQLIGSTEGRACE